jgi:hypothetical protein
MRSFISRTRACYFQASVEITRTRARSAIKPEIISTTYLELRKLKSTTREAIMLNHSAYLAEATTSNVFFVSRGELCTPAFVRPDGGHTRFIVAVAAMRSGVAFKEGKFRKSLFSTPTRRFFRHDIKICLFGKYYDVEDERTVRIGTGRPDSLPKLLAGGRK